MVNGNHKAATYLAHVLTTVKQYAHNLSQRRLSIAGRGPVVNSLLLSRVWHTIRILAVPQTFLRKLRSTIIQFLAHKAFPAVSFATCTRLRTEGGPGVLDPFAQHSALQLRWVLPLHHVDFATHDSFVMPILRYCIAVFSGTTDTALALGFSKCHTGHLKALSPIKAMLSTATKLGLQPCLGTYTPANVLELPILVLCRDLPRRPPDPDQAATYEWNKLFVNDAFYYHHTLGKFRRMLPPSRDARSRLINLLFQYLDTFTGYIAPPLMRLLDDATAMTLTQSSLPDNTTNCKWLYSCKLNLKHGFFLQAFFLHFLTSIPSPFAE